MDNNHPPFIRAIVRQGLLTTAVWGLIITESFLPRPPLVRQIPHSVWLAGFAALVVVSGAVRLIKRWRSRRMTVGHPVAATARCIRCKHEIIPGVIHCPYCRASVTAPGEEEILPAVSRAAAR